MHSISKVAFRLLDWYNIMQMGRNNQNLVINVIDRIDKKGQVLSNSWLQRKHFSTILCKTGSIGINANLFLLNQYQLKGSECMIIVNT